MKQEQPRWSYRNCGPYRTHDSPSLFFALSDFHSSQFFCSFSRKRRNRYHDHKSKSPTFWNPSFGPDPYRSQKEFSFESKIWLSTCLSHRSLSSIFHLVIWVLFAHTFSISLWCLFRGCFLFGCCLLCWFGRSSATSSSGPFQPLYSFLSYSRLRTLVQMRRLELEHS